jgi:hypothetical protein
VSEAAAVRRARFHLLRAQDALNVALRSLDAAAVPEASRPVMLDQVQQIQRKAAQLLTLLATQPRQPA